MSITTTQELLDKAGVRNINIAFVPAMKSMAISEAQELINSVLNICLDSKEKNNFNINDKGLI